MKLVLLAIALIPSISHAAEYACNGANGWEAIEASSQAEALHTANARWARNGGCVLGSPNDSFAIDAWFSHRQHLRPYLPADIKQIQNTNRRKAAAPTNTSFLCDSSGGFLPDSSADKGYCSELDSKSMGKWKIRVAEKSDSDIWLWRKSAADWRFWAHVTPAAPVEVSSEAREYAKGRGFATQEAFSSSTPNRSQPIKPADAVQDAVKRGVGDLLKGLGK